MVPFVSWVSRFSSHSGAAKGEAALTQLIQKAADDVGEASAALLFCAPDVDARLLTKVAASFPFPIAFATTAGHFTAAGRCDDQVIVCALSDVTVLPAFAKNIGETNRHAGTELTEGFLGAVKTARQDGRTHAATVVLMDGLASNGEQVVEEIRRATQPHQIIVGGGAGDNGAFKSTTVGLDSDASTSGAVALHVFDRHRWGVGLGHGLRPATPRMTVTSATGSLIREIDGRPAFDVYSDFANSRGETITPGAIGTFMIRHELGVYFFDELRFARAPLKVLPDGSIRCAAGIREGSTVCILDGDDESMITAARAAAAEAKRNLRGEKAAGVLVFNCICRGLLLGPEFKREIAAIASEFPGVPVAGFLTYGEIARYGGRLQGWHNSTAVVVAIPA